MQNENAFSPNSDKMIIYDYLLAAVVTRLNWRVFVWSSGFVQQV